MHERPHRAVVDLEAALSRQLGDQAAQRERPIAAALDQPVAMRARNRAWFVAAHLARCDAGGLTEPFDPVDRGADRNTEAGRGLVARQAAVLHGSNNAFAKII